MFKLDNAFLEELGLGSLPVDEKNKLLQHIYETLEMNVGMRLAEKMTDEQLDEFESFIDRNDEPGALNWLESNFPNYRDVVTEELEKLKTVVRNDAPKILSTSGARDGMMPQPPQPPQVPQPLQPHTQQQNNMPMPPQPLTQPQPVPQPMSSYQPAPSYQPAMQPPQVPQPSHQPTMTPYGPPSDPYATQGGQGGPAAQDSFSPSQNPSPMPPQPPMDQPYQPPAPDTFEPPEPVATPWPDPAQFSSFPAQQPPAGPGGQDAPQTLPPEPSAPEPSQPEPWPPLPPRPSDQNNDQPQQFPPQPPPQY